VDKGHLRAFVDIGAELEVIEDDRKGRIDVRKLKERLGGLLIE